MSRIRNASNRKGGLQLGDVEQCALRSGNVHSADCYSADGWARGVGAAAPLSQGHREALYFRAMRAAGRVPMGRSLVRR